MPEDWNDLDSNTRSGVIASLVMIDKLTSEALDYIRRGSRTSKVRFRLSEIESLTRDALGSLGVED